ncbi:MAG: hypothetical protein LH702_37165 [Phormidesmis sp. CAN_BIN44]|nr:hypothetical protein [Phormidesmis sp. CAN_BIN44]
MSGNNSSQHDPFSIIVIGASAGGVETLTQLVRLLPRELKAAVLIFNSMPMSEIANVAVDYVLPVAEIASVLVERSNHQTSNRAMDNKRDPEVEIIQQDKALAEQGEPQKEPSIFTCPDCGGVM